MNAFERCLLHTIRIRFAGNSWRLPFHRFLKVIGRDNTEPEVAGAIANTLREPWFRSALYDHNVALWIGRGDDQDIRVVDLTAMRLRQDVGRGVCRLCLIDEEQPHLTLARDVDLDNNVIKDSFVHPLCQKTLRELRLKQREAVKNG